MFSTLRPPGDKITGDLFIPSLFMWFPLTSPIPKLSPRSPLNLGPRAQIKPVHSSMTGSDRQAASDYHGLFSSSHSAKNSRGLILSTCPTEGFQKCAIHSPTPFPWDCSLQLSPKFTKFVVRTLLINKLGPYFRRHCRAL